MELKLAAYYATLLSLAAFVTLGDAQTTTTAVPESTDGASSMPPASTACLASNAVTGGNFVDCCPSADPNDGICTLIWCIDRESEGSLIRDNCGCGDVETACSQLAMFAGMISGLSEACAAMGECCEAGVTANSDFASCTQESLVALNLTLPDYDALVPGGVPDLNAILTGTATTAAAESTEAGASSTTVPEEEGVTTTVAVATIPAEITTTVSAVTIPAEVTTTVAAVTIPAEVTTTVAAATTTAAPKDAAATTNGAISYYCAVNTVLSFIVIISLAVQNFV